MCFYCILKGLFCIGEGTKTWGHGCEQAFFEWTIFRVLVLVSTVIPLSIRTHLIFGHQ